MMLQNQSALANESIGLDVQPAEIAEFLKHALQYRSIEQSIVQLKIIAQAAAARHLTVETAAIQAEGERQRRELQLEKASDTFAWLADQKVTPEEWEQGIRDRLLAQQLSEDLFGKDVEQFFGEHRLDYDRIVFYQIILPEPQLAQELIYQLEESEISFYEAAHLYHVHEEGRQRCGFEGVIQRLALPPNLAAAVFGVPIGQVAGPVQTHQGYHLLRVEELIQATLTPEIRQAIINRKFQEWLSSEFNYAVSQAT
jgi:parvulin-like peptidyl-prolyl isomerase